MPKRRLMRKRRRERRQAHLLSWIMGAAVWLWMVNASIVRGLRPTSIIRDHTGTSSVLDQRNFVFFALNSDSSPR